MNFDYEIEYPGRNSEFEVQAELYMALKNKGFDVKGEVPALHSVFDLVVFKCCRPKCIIEVKATIDIDRLRRRLNRRYQYKKYMSFGIPLVYCCALVEIDMCIGIVSKILTDDSYAKSYTEAGTPVFKKESWRSDPPLTLNESFFEDIR